MGTMPGAAGFAAVEAMTMPGGNRLGLHLVTHRSAKTSTSKMHVPWNPPFLTRNLQFASYYQSE
jgi:hypothetical protein